jgi:hypothetical protein
MPYIITTDNASPVAVATVDDAREAVFERVWGNHSLARSGALLAVADAIHGLSEAGCTLGPFRDGPVVQVKPITYRELLDALGVKFIAAPDSLASAIREYNARNGAELYG